MRRYLSTQSPCSLVQSDCGFYVDVIEHYDKDSLSLSTVVNMETGLKDVKAVGHC